MTLPADLPARDLAELVNAAINIGAEIALDALGLADKKPDLFLRNPTFTAARNRRRAELVGAVKVPRKAKRNVSKKAE